MAPPQPQPAPTQPAAPPPACGFHDPQGVVVSETQVRNAVVAAAGAERVTWFVGGAYQMEDVPARFGNLVGYWLAGNRGNGGIRPDALVAARQAALSPKVTYATLVDAPLATAVKDFRKKEDEFNDETLNVYARWKEEEEAAEALKVAEDKLKAAGPSLTEAKKKVEAARRAEAKASAQVKAGTAQQAVLVQATADLAAASAVLTAVEAAQKERDNAAAALRAATKARTDAQAKRGRARAARNKLNPAAIAVKDANKKKVAGQLLAELAAGAPAVDRAVVNEALQKSHEAASDADAWSAVFVVSCVRSAAIGLGLETFTGGSQQGRDVLLLTSNRHMEYIVEARERKGRGQTGTYHAFSPAGRTVKPGDIIALDRTDEIRQPVQLDKLGGQIALHCDIVTSIILDNGKPVFAETIGGNVSNTVRRRRYPLNPSGELLVSKDHEYLQEDDKGSFGAPVARTLTPSILPLRSTFRIFALLSLVERCAVPKTSAFRWNGGIGRALFGAAASPWGVRGIGAGFMNSLETLESPFLDEGLLHAEPRLEAAEPAPAFLPEAPGAAALDEYDPADREDPRAAWETEDAAEHEAAYDFEWAHESEPDFGAERDFEAEPDFEGERKDLDPAETIDELAAQPLFPQAVRDRLESLLDAKRVRDASVWNAARHPAQSEISAATLLTRLGLYVNRSACEKAMRDSAELNALAGDEGALLAFMAHQFQQKIYTPPDDKKKEKRDGKIGEGTLDALGFVRHRDGGLNPADELNVKFHVKGRSKAFRRIEDVYKKDPNAFAELGTDVSARTWYDLFVNAPFLGRPFKRGVHVELMRRLRRAERWLLGRPLYRGMSPVELGAALGIDEDHGGGRPNNSASMHTLGLAIDIGYVKNPWVAGQPGKENKGRNAAFKAVTKNVSQLLGRNEGALTPEWLSGLGSEAGRTTESAYDEIQLRHTTLQVYLSLENDAAALKTVIHRRSQGLNPELVIGPKEKLDAAVARWRRIIRDDRARFKRALESDSAVRNPADGFLNLQRDLVVALRDHGCLAWGAIDFGTRQSGDMMHFDCRAEGVGWRLALDEQRTAGAGHPCVAKKSAAESLASEEPAEELEKPSAAPPSPATPEGFLGGLLWTFKARTLPMRVAVFCPKAVTDPTRVELLVYAHGLIAPCESDPVKGPADIIKKRPFELGKIVEASGRAVVLVVPFMEWENVKKGRLGFGPGDKQHLLGKPSNLNGVTAEVLAEIGRVHAAAPPALTNLILAGHSRAYGLFNPLAQAHAEPEMSLGPLARLSRVWALDTTYGAPPVGDWTKWLASKPRLRVEVLYIPGTRERSSPTDAGGKAFEGAASASAGRLSVTRVGERHCRVPTQRLPALLKPSAPTTPEVGAEPDAGETFERDADEEFAREADDEAGGAWGSSEWADEGPPAEGEAEDIAYETEETGSEAEAVGYEWAGSAEGEGEDTGSGEGEGDGQESEKPDPRRAAPAQAPRSVGIVRVPTAAVVGQPSGSASKQDSLSKGTVVERILAKRQTDGVWWYQIEYGGGSKKGWVVGEQISELAWPGEFTFNTPGSSTPFEELRDAVRGRAVEEKVARAVNHLNVQLLPADDLTLSRFCANAFYNALVPAQGNFKEACLIVTAAVRAFKDAGGRFRWVQQPEERSKKFSYAAYADKVWHFFWNAYKRLDGTSAWKLDQLGLLYELKSRPNPIASLFTLKELDRDSREDIGFNRGGVALAEWLNKNHPAIMQHHTAAVRDNFLKVAADMKLPPKQAAEVIQQLMETESVRTELQKRSYEDYAAAVEKHADAVLEAIARMKR